MMSMIITTKTIAVTIDSLVRLSVNIEGSIIFKYKRNHYLSQLMVMGEMNYIVLCCFGEDNTWRN